MLSLHIWLQSRQQQHPAVCYPELLWKTLHLHDNCMYSESLSYKWQWSLDNRHKYKHCFQTMYIISSALFFFSQPLRHRNDSGGFRTTVRFNACASCTPIQGTGKKHNQPRGLTQIMRDPRKNHSHLSGLQLISTFFSSFFLFSLQKNLIF